ncbi:MAG TPA: hypothetical protein VG406_00570, partial [Isosphaeraceae bacterium]|nr:hypothetical protein [Isosphaeraceae bacterium]
KGKEGVDVAFIDHPSVIGDNYAEIIGGLSRLADAGMGLRIVRREPARSPSGGKSLPRPTVSVPEHGDDPSKFGAAGIKGMVVNPIYAGVADYPKMIPDEEWVGAVTKVIEEDGAEQFLVNLLYVLRRTFGCVEWDGHLPPDVN